MGDIFERLGNLLSEKIRDEEEKQNNETNKNEPEIHFPDGNNSSDKKISEKAPIITEILLKKEENHIGEVIHPGQFTEDQPVKIINGDVTFSK